VRKQRSFEHRSFISLESSLGEHGLSGLRSFLESGVSQYIEGSFFRCICSFLESGVSQYVKSSIISRIDRSFDGFILVRIECDIASAFQS
jgi:hypothetical protein